MSSNTRTSSNLFAQAVFAVVGFCGFALAFGLGWLLLARFALPAPSPAWTAEQLASFYIDHQTRIRLGCILGLFGTAIYALPLGVLAARLRKSEKGLPIFTYTAVILITLALLFVILPFVAWSVAAFRPGQIDPQITQAFNDLGWFFFLFTWPVLTVVFTLVAVAILRAERGTEPLPRWTAYFALWCGLLLAGSVLIIFFKDGPFAYDGLVGLYIPAAATVAFQVGLFLAIMQALVTEYRTDTGVSSLRQLIKQTVS